MNREPDAKELKDLNYAKAIEDLKARGVMTMEEFRAALEEHGLIVKEDRACAVEHGEPK